jgi:spore coat protein A, manganese oxidase
MGETMGSLSVSRRDVLKVSALGAAALALPFERVARAKTASKIAENKIPRPYTLPFKVPPVIDGRGGARSPSRRRCRTP